MSFLGALRKLPDVNVVSLNFSSESSPDLLIQCLELNCDYQTTPKGLTLAPKLLETWIVVFCDEINLPSPDKYGTQNIISLIRQLVEYKGFWRSDRSWINVERIQFVGACNPSTDPGRYPLDARFLRNCGVVFFDYPCSEALGTIYGTFIRALFKSFPNLRAYSDLVSLSMIEFYEQIRLMFKSDEQIHYIYSPRELTRWIRGLHEILTHLEIVSLDDFVRAWAHEGLRIFQDRLVTIEEKDLAYTKLIMIAQRHFPNVEIQQCLAQPILFSNLLSHSYQSVDKMELKSFITGKLHVYVEEETQVNLVMFDKALEHLLRIDRALKQPGGHLVLIGLSGSGKSTLSKFAAWLNGIHVVEPSMHKGYNLLQFDEDLKIILKRAGIKKEKICLLLDEGSVTDASFFERMNTLLANAEIPGLFEGDEQTMLLSSCRDVAQREGLNLNTTDDLLRFFSRNIRSNLHVVFTMNPTEGKLAAKASSSPALFNRCILNWMGDWDIQAFYQVAHENLQYLDLDGSFTPPATFKPAHITEKPYTIKDAVVDMAYHIHVSTAKLNDSVRIKVNGASGIYITPGQFLDFIQKIVVIYKEKRSYVEDRQHHLIAGLEKLKETLQRVAELRKSLDSKQNKLEDKTNLANEKLRQMIKDQQEAEKKQAASLDLKKALKEQKALIEERRKIVVSDLAKAEPALIEAQQSVSSIKRQHLVEVRSMANPPAAVKLTMEAVCILLGSKVDSWKSVQAILRRDDFISSIVNYSSDSLTKYIRLEISNSYLSDPNFTFEVVNHASKACGPLLKWVIALISYAEILEKVGPMREEVKELEVRASATMEKSVETNKLVLSLEDSIARYKDEYATLISETQILKSEMEQVKNRVERSVKIVENLSSETSRWQESSEGFEKEIQTLIGDVIISAGYITYAGYFDQYYRKQLMDKWYERLKKCGISFQKQLSIPDFLASAETMKDFMDSNLPSDKLCIENAVMISRSIRYPLLIDPSGQAKNFMMSYFKSNNIVLSSFRDKNFVKTLEIAVRFGNYILIEDAEDFDPIINPILTRQLRRHGGRTLCQLGNKEIDCSPKFRLFLTTTNPTLCFSPDISSRVTFVNFTITPTSLQIQCLDHILHSERPDIEEKRNNLSKMQGEFQFRLFHLEKSLLSALSESEGNILDNEAALKTLETLKIESNDIRTKMLTMESTLTEIELITSKYESLAEICSELYFMIEKLQFVKQFYQFSLEYYFTLFEEVMLAHTKKGKGVEQLEIELFLYVYESISLSMRGEDIYLLAFSMAQIMDRQHTRSKEEKIFLTSSAQIIRDESILTPLISKFGECCISKILELSKLPVFSVLPQLVLKNPDAWMNLSETPDPAIYFQQQSLPFSDGNSHFT
jgi:dynein heavy chain 1